MQIDALEPTPAREGELKSSPTLGLPASEDPGKRAEAAAAWRAIAAAPEEAQREAQRLQALETTLNALREQTVQNQRTLLALRTELTEARQSRYRNPLVYALIGLLLLALLGLALMWRALRRAVAPAWWGEGLEPGRARRSPTGPQSDDRDRPAGPQRVAPGSTFAPLEPEEEENVEAPPATPVPNVLAHPAQRLVNTEELFDVQQQSDFFLSLGQHDQAIAVLREHIAANPDTSALAFLDLLKIYHLRGRKEEYDRLRQDFLRNFNAGVPEFEHFEDAGRGLEHYRGALARIEAQWPASGTLQLIEELVFRKPGKREEDSFDLAAYRELLLLYSVAKEVIDPNSAPPAPVTPLSFADTTVHPHLPTAPIPLTAHAAVPAATAAFVADTEPLSPDTAPAVLDAGPTLPTSLFGAIEEGLQDETVMAPDAPAAGRSEPPPARPNRELDFTEVDRTAYETLASPLDDPAASLAAVPAPEADPHVIDFELFDPATEAEIAPQKLPKKG